MINISYSLSPILKDNLSKIASLRHQILLAIVPPKLETAQRFHTIVGRIFYSLALSETNFPMDKISKLLFSHGLGLSYRKRTIYGSKSDEQLVLDYKNGLDFISQNWLATPESITARTITTLHSIACPGRLRSENAIRQIVDYLDSSPQENPVIQAAIALIEIANSSPFTDGNGRISRLTCYLYLYKYGLDFRGLLSLEEFLFTTQPEFKEYQQIAEQNSNLTHWLEYFTAGLALQLQKALTTLTKYPAKDYTLKIGELTDRQKSILTFLELPESTITNKRVQKIFKVSQITASRDLARLSALGSIFAQGKGRSTRYRKSP